MGVNDFDCICAVGPNHSGPNILLCDPPWNEWRAAWLGPRMSVREPVEDGTIETSACDPRLLAFRSSILNGFQLASEHGPLCEAPMWGVCFRLKNLAFNDAIDKHVIPLRLVV